MDGLDKKVGFFVELVVKSFEELTKDELYEILRARQEIFIVEQNCPYLDADGIDQGATHVFLRDEIGIAAYTRIYWEKERESSVKIGRVIAVRRGTGAGLRIMEESVRIAEEQFRPKELYIHAQEYAKGFYEKVGFQVISTPFLEDDIFHVAMAITI